LPERPERRGIGVFILPTGEGWCILAGSKTDFFENRVLNIALRGALQAAAVTPYVALLTGTLTGDTPGTEVTGGGYARVSAPAATWGPTSGAAGDSTAGTLTNAAVITFPTSTGAWSAGASITHFGIFDAATVGNALYYGDLTTPQTVGATGITVSFALGTLTLTEG